MNENLYNDIMEELRGINSFLQNNIIVGDGSESSILESHKSALERKQTVGFIHREVVFPVLLSVWDNWEIWK